MASSNGEAPKTRLLERVMSVIYAMSAAEQQHFGVTELSRALDLPKTVVHRTLRGLVEERFVTYNEYLRKYSLGPGAFAVGAAAMRRFALQERVRHVLEEVADVTQETATFSTLQGRSRVYIDQVASHQSRRFEVSVGKQFPLHAGSSSKSILATYSEPEIDSILSKQLDRLTPRTVTDIDDLKTQLRQIRKRGYAFSIGERDLRGGGVAAALQQNDGSAFGSISVCFPANRFDADRVQLYGEVVMNAARSINRYMASREVTARPS